jgi:proline dehydrogenase
MGLLDQFIVRTLPFVPKPIVKRLSRPYIAGSELEQARAVVMSLNSKGFRTTIDLLGEFVDSFDQVEENLRGYQAILDMIHSHKLNANISIKPTSFGLLLDGQRCQTLLSGLMERVSAQGNFMRIDMEDSHCTSPTIELYQQLRSRWPEQVGVVLQAYLHRTPQDVAAITESQPGRFRLCKGIYVEPPQVAIKDYQAIRRQFLAVLQSMLQSGSHVGIATHDDVLVEGAYELIHRLQIPKERYEFQMLLGVREPLRDSILAAGHPVRIYVPFGSRWYEYSVRRLKENPALAGTMFKAIFFG